MSFKVINFNWMSEDELWPYIGDENEPLYAMLCNNPECYEEGWYMDYFEDEDTGFSWYQCPNCGKEVENDIYDIREHLESLPH